MQTDMSKEKTKEQVLLHKNKTIEILDVFLTELADIHPKKTDLISYWLHTYTNYIKFEESFDPKRNKRYERGDIIKVDFGFNIGSEYGGLHYAVVIDNNNNLSSPVVTVIPLSSTDDKIISKYNIDIGDELYLNLRLKILGMTQTIKSEKDSINQTLSLLDTLLSTVQTGAVEMSKERFEETQKLIEENKKRIAHLNSKRKDLSKMLNELNKMKSGSMALVSQIRCISKIRIVDPKTTHGVLNGVKLSPNNMNKIDSKILEMFTKG